jgi:hypothetical protein
VKVPLCLGFRLVFRRTPMFILEIQSSSGPICQVRDSGLTINSYASYTDIKSLRSCERNVIERHLWVRGMSLSDTLGEKYPQLPICIFTASSVLIRYSQRERSSFTTGPTSLSPALLLFLSSIQNDTIQTNGCFPFQVHFRDCAWTVLCDFKTATSMVGSVLRTASVAVWKPSG